MNELRIVTRKSPLAMWQANHVRARLEEAHHGLHVRITGVMTEADRFLDRRLPAMGGKGVYVKELEQALLSGAADIAVHSVKDVPVDLPAGLGLAAILERDDPRDVLISAAGTDLDALPAGTRVGTSSLRRRCQLSGRRPDLELRDIRGNVGTRLDKLDSGEFDALILAAAGVRRLGLDKRVSQYLDTGVMLPAIGQGAVGVECRSDDAEVRALLEPLAHAGTGLCVAAERIVNRRLHGDCQVPIAAHAVIMGGRMSLTALVGGADGSGILRRSGEDDAARAEALGDRIARDMLAAGADRILEQYRDAGASD